MKKRMPEAFDELMETIQSLEEHYRDMQDIEFTVEQRQALPPPDAGREAHGGGRAQAAVDMVDEGLIAREEAVARIDPGAARPAPAPDARPERAATRSRARA